MISSTTGLGLAFLTRDLARSAMVSGTSWGNSSVGGIWSGSAVATAALGAAVAGGTDDAGSINPFGGFFLGFGRGFFAATSGSARISPLDVEAPVLSAMAAAVEWGLTCGGFVLSRW